MKTIKQPSTDKKIPFSYCGLSAAHCSLLHTLLHDFFWCGIAGWIVEILFTSLKSLQSRDKCLHGETSLWMFPIYGMGAVIHPLSVLFIKLRFPAWLRGFLYGSLIFIVEFVSGSWLQKRKCCPWSYVRSHLNIKGVIRLDYFGYWALLGLFLEKKLARRSTAADPR